MLLIIYLLLVLVSLGLVVSTKVNTDNTLKLIGIGFIAVGALVSIEIGFSILIVIGILAYLLSDLITAYFGKRQRRNYDKVVNN